MSRGRAKGEKRVREDQLTTTSRHALQMGLASCLAFLAPRNSRREEDFVVDDGAGGYFDDGEEHIFEGSAADRAAAAAQAKADAAEKARRQRIKSARKRGGASSGISGVSCHLMFPISLAASAGVRTLSAIQLPSLRSD